MLYINIIFITLVAFAIGYIFGKGKIEIVKRIEPTKEQQEQIEKVQREMQQAIEVYNESLKHLTY